MIRKSCWKKFKLLRTAGELPCKAGHTRFGTLAQYYKLPFTTKKDLSCIPKNSRSNTTNECKARHTPKITTIYANCVGTHIYIYICQLAPYQAQRQIKNTTV
ncbi:unnamed protein product [Ectocarpus sp. 12 AP-2014]